MNAIQGLDSSATYHVELRIIRGCDTSDDNEMGGNGEAGFHSSFFSRTPFL